MPLVQVDGGMVEVLNHLCATYLRTLKIGLFQNNWRPRKGDSIGFVVPADYSGYPGLIDLVGWLPAELYGDLAVSAATIRTWGHDGGPDGNWIHGIYVVNLANKLIWAERDPAAPIPMESALSVYTYIPRYAVGSRFSE